MGKKSYTIFNGCLQAVALFSVLSFSSAAKAELKPLYAIYPVHCADEIANRIEARSYCLNRVSGTVLEVFSISTAERSKEPKVVYYLVSQSYDAPRKSSDGLLQVIVPAKRVKRLEPATVVKDGGYVILKSVDFQNGGQSFESAAKGPFVTLESADHDVAQVPESDTGLLISGHNLPVTFNQVELRPMAVTRGR